MARASEADGVTIIFGTSYWGTDWLKVEELPDILKLQPIFENKNDVSTVAPKFQEYVYGEPCRLLLCDTLDRTHSEFSGFTLNDGSCIAYTHEPYDYVALQGPMVLPVAIDTNCNKGPNKGGRDRFIVHVSTVGTVHHTLSLEFGEDYLKICKRDKDIKDSYPYASDDDVDTAALYCGDIINS